MDTIVLYRYPHVQHLGAFRLLLGRLTRRVPVGLGRLSFIRKFLAAQCWPRFGSLPIRGHSEAGG